jgi:hypothetical protein
MRWRALLLLPTIGLSVASVSCPWTEEAIAEPEPLPVAKAPPPLVRAKSAPKPAAPLPKPAPKPAAPTTIAAVATSLPADPALAPTLPPELVDDGSDDLPDPDPPPPPKRKEREVFELASTAKETWVFATPNWKARRIGYLRAGSIVERRAEPVGKNRSCQGGWYRIEPRGYVCVGDKATLDVFHPVVEASKKRPVLDAGLPYTYVMSRFPPPPLYARLPSAAELAKVEPDLKGHLRKVARMALEPEFVAPPPAEPVPGALLYGMRAPKLGDEHRSRSAVSIGHARARSGFALLSTFDYEGRRYGLTTELAVIPIDRTRVIKPSTFHGIELDDETTLPVAFVRSKHASRWIVGPGGAITKGAPLAFREAVPITGRERRIAGQSYLVAKDGTLIPSDRAVKVDRFRHAPAWATGDRTWIDVSILKQALVAYRGKKPVYVTLVSTGADGIGDPKKTHSTIQGAFLVHTKHVSVTMDDDKIGDEFDFRDVPFVQYFTEGFALHAAYWHDEFGTPRSHGCVNLAPIDASWLFRFTEPKVPEGWHGALSLKKGTLVYTHP